MPEIYRISVDLDGREINSFVKEGALSTVELGSLENNEERPSHRICAIVARSEDEPTAWVQLSSFQDGRFILSSEGWFTLGQEPVPTGAIPAATGRLTIASVEDLGTIKPNPEARFGVLACCTSNGNGCYVRCCNSCCSDPVGCPGASCCA